MLDIKNETTEFLRYQSIGTCPNNFKKRFSKPINFSEPTKNALKKIWRHLGFKQSLDLSDQEYCLIQRALLNLDVMSQSQKRI
jgi:hypothetical protein